MTVTPELRAKVRELNQERRIDPVSGNQAPTVARWLDQAARHLDSATKLVGDDPAMALEAVHQACRKGLVAHLLAAGHSEIAQHVDGGPSRGPRNGPGGNDHGNHHNGPHQTQIAPRHRQA